MWSAMTHIITHSHTHPQSPPQPHLYTVTLKQSSPTVTHTQPYTYAHKYTVFQVQKVLILSMYHGNPVVPGKCIVCRATCTQRYSHTQIHCLTHIHTIKHIHKLSHTPAITLPLSYTFRELGNSMEAEGRFPSLHISTSLTFSYGCVSVPQSHL